MVGMGELVTACFMHDMSEYHHQLTCTGGCDCPQSRPGDGGGGDKPGNKASCNCITS